MVSEQEFREYLEAHYIAWKLWSREDVAEMLKEAHYSDADENVDAVINSCCIDALNDCTDQDWNIIDNAITYAKNTSGLILCRTDYYEIKREPRESEFIATIKNTTDHDITISFGEDRDLTPIAIKAKGQFGIPADEFGCRIWDVIHGRHVLGLM